jgi:excisionase family DNA binding protein
MDTFSLKVSDAAKHYRISRYTLYQLIRNGELPAICPPGRDMYVLAKDIEAWLLKHRVVKEPAVTP